MRTFFAAFALLATVNAAGGGAETPKEKTAKVTELQFNSTTSGEFVKFEYLQRLVDDKASLIVASVIRSGKDDLYDARLNVNLRNKGETDCTARYVVDAAQTGANAGKALQ